MPDRSPPQTEEERYHALQSRLAPLWQRIEPDRLAPRTVVVVPSLSLPSEEMLKIRGAHHYEERLLCLLMLLRLPRTRVVFVTSQAIDPSIIDYYLHLLAGVPTGHARSRLSMFHCGDAAPVPLSEKILARPLLLDRIRQSLHDPELAHLACFVATDAERRLALALGIPLYACDPGLADLGTKSGSRELFREAGVPMPDGIERLRDADDVGEALATLKAREPSLRRAVVKLNHGFSGEGNAIFSYEGAPAEVTPRWAKGRLAEELRYEAQTETWERFAAKIEEMGAVVEAFVEGEGKASPSVQCRVEPTGRFEVISTHDQVLGGRSSQLFLGARFPAREDYRGHLAQEGRKVAQVLADKGAIGRFSVDFVSVPQPDGSWAHSAIEINLRKGGTTHPFIMLHYLTDGHFEEESGLFRIAGGAPRFYVATDNLESERYRGLIADDLIDIAVRRNLHFHGPWQEGVVFHLIGALSEFGKLGMVAIGATAERAQTLYDRAEAILDEETASASATT